MTVTLTVTHQEKTSALSTSTVAESVRYACADSELIFELLICDIVPVMKHTQSFMFVAAVSSVADQVDDPLGTVIVYLPSTLNSFGHHATHVYSHTLP